MNPKDRKVRPSSKCVVKKAQPHILTSKPSNRCDESSSIDSDCFNDQQLNTPESRLIVLHAPRNLPSLTSDSEEETFPFEEKQDKTIIRNMLLPPNSAILNADKRKLKCAYKNHEICRLKQLHVVIPCEPCRTRRRRKSFLTPPNSEPKPTKEFKYVPVDISPCETDDLFSEPEAEITESEVMETKIVLPELVLEEADTNMVHNAANRLPQVQESDPAAAKSNPKATDSCLKASATIYDLTAQTPEESAPIPEQSAPIPEQSAALPDPHDELIMPAGEIQQTTEIKPIVKPKNLKMRHPLQLDYISYVTADPKALSTMGVFNNRGQVTKEAAKKLKDAKTRAVVGKNFPFRQPRQTPMPELPPTSRNKCQSHQRKGEDLSSSSSGSLSDSWFVRS